MKEFSAMARSHVPGCFALLAHPFVAVSVMQPRSPMGPLGLHKLEEVHCVRVFPRACSALASGANNVCSPKNTWSCKVQKPSLGAVAPWSVFHLPKRSWSQTGTRNRFSVWFLTYCSCVPPHTHTLIPGAHIHMHAAGEWYLNRVKSEQLYYTTANEKHHIYGVNLKHLSTFINTTICVRHHDGL